MIVTSSLRSQIVTSNLYVVILKFQSGTPRSHIDTLVFTSLTNVIPYAVQVSRVREVDLTRLSISLFGDC